MKAPKLLSLDAGGIKGIYTVLVLSGIAKTHKINLNTDFDYYVGTSIGAVINTCLAYGITCDQILDKFCALGNEMHKGHIHLTNELFKWIDEVFQETKITEIKRNLFIPLFDISRSSHTFINNYSDSGISSESKVADVLKAACSDLRIMPPYNLSRAENRSFSDAGIFAYDPILFFLRHNEYVLKLEPRIVSIGSGLIKNASTDINKSALFDLMYDSFLHEQFMMTKLFFDNTPNIKYLRISEFPSIDTAVFFSDLSNIVQRKISEINNDSSAKRVLSFNNK